MKKLIPILTIATVFMVACESKTTTTATTDSTINSSTETQTGSAQCFQYVKNRDTAGLTLNIEDEKVTGSLSYNLFEKDKNKGVIAGIVKGDTIIADYTFQSEGITSIRQVAWLRQNDQLIEGFGDVEEVDGKTKFKNIGKLTFGKSTIFSKTNCK
ncbi:hypothetical protein DU508_18030 [Pedobacter chinensis]|uniref:Lipoprotein n=1 Tax=Pedobacter chinensis TaxID=2282421 RepID=A0A369PRW3_9SPHI|nr:hypothetical protein [Pedobacter chinensis]RDC55052.1 hypothetical protein DU508_18030 [Pedobacter chinensis]